MAYDTRCLGEKGWVGVVLRNLPHNATSKGVMNNFSDSQKLRKHGLDYAHEALIVED